MAEGSSGGKPADFFVGLVDFFAILLPGAMLGFVLYECVVPWNAALSRMSIPDSWVTAAVVALVSYVLGHFLSIVASLYLDPLYDCWKRIPVPFRSKSLKDLDDLRDETAQKQGLESVDFSNAATSLRVWSPGAAGEMDHLEADQKFFRGLILVFLAAWVAFLADWKGGALWLWRGAVLLVLPIPLLPILNAIWKEDSKAAAPQANAAAPDANKPASTTPGSIVNFCTLSFLLAGWVVWFATTPMSHERPAATGAPTSENTALSVNAKAGGISVEAKSENISTANLIWPIVRDYPVQVQAVLLFALVLSVVRFVQLRVKYTKFVYEAYVVLKSSK